MKPATMVLLLLALPSVAQASNSLDERQPAIKRGKTNLAAKGSSTVSAPVRGVPDVLNVRDFGARGDCVHDDLPALNAAEQKAREAGGGTIYLPRPRCAYRLTDTWVVGQGRVISEEDMRYVPGVHVNFDISTLPSYSAANLKANKLEPLYEIVAEPGTFIWGDFTSPTRKAILYYTAIGDMWQNHRHKRSPRVEGITFIGKDGFTGRPPTRGVIDLYEPLSETNRQVGLAYLYSRLSMHLLQFEQLDVGLLSWFAHWSSATMLKAWHNNIGYYVISASNTSWSDVSAYYCREWGLVLSGDAVRLSMYGTEQNVRDIWVPFADYLHWDGGYVESTARAANPPWVPNTMYQTVGAVVRSGGNLYKLVRPGVSARSGGPRTKGDHILDGTAHWKFLGPAFRYVFGDAQNTATTWQVGRSSVDHVKFNAADDKGLYLFASNISMTNSRIRDDETMIVDADSQLLQMNMDPAITYARGSRTDRAVTLTSSGEQERLTGDLTITGALDVDRLFARKGDLALGADDTAPRVITGRGPPERIVSAPAGSLYLRSDGVPKETLYVKESGSGSTGWVAK